METPRNEVTLGARLATRYVPNQILSSTLSWGPLIGVEEVLRLGERFAARSITSDGDPALTKEWLIHYIMEILEEKARFASSSVELEDVVNSEMQLLNEDKMSVYREEVLRWVSSFSIQVSVHDPLWEACEASNVGIACLERSTCSTTRTNSVHTVTSFRTSPQVKSTTTVDITPSAANSGIGAESKPRKGCLDRSRSVARMLLNYNLPSIHTVSLRKGPTQHEIVRWSDLTTNFVKDYERFHQSDEKELSFTRVRAGTTSGRISHPHFSHGRDGAEGNSSNVPGIRQDSESEALTGKELHVQSADQILVSRLTGCVITASKDGIVKLWDGNTGEFMRNLYNAGAAWVIGMFLLPDEDYILIATTNGQLTVLDFPEGNVLQKYLGCASLQTAFYEVLQLSATKVYRYGMKPGECGMYHVTLRKDESAEEYHRRRHETQNHTFSKVLPAKPVVGFEAPTASWFDNFSGIFFFGTVDGVVGAFDISADVRPSSLLAGANSKPVPLLFSAEVHTAAVVGMFYTSYVTSLFTAGADGCIYRTPLGPTGKPAGEARLVLQQTRGIRAMQWWPPSKFYVTIHVDRRVALWVIGRHGDPLFEFPSETQGIVSAALHPRRNRLALLLSDKTIKVYETHGSRSLATIAQPARESNFTATDASQQMMERSAIDEDGVVAWHPLHSCLICCLRGTVVYEPSLGHMQAEISEGSGHTTRGDEQEASSTGYSQELNMDIKDKPKMQGSVGFVGTQRMDTHRGGVVAMVVHRQSWQLHTFDEVCWRTWDLTTGELKRNVNIPRIARMERMPVKRATVTSCSWTTTLQTRLATGGQDGSVLTWDPSTAAPLAAEMLVQDLSEQLDSDVTVVSHRNKLIAWSARVCRVTTFNVGLLLPSGLEESKSVVVRVPSLASVTACCVVRDAYLCMGTGDARIFFFSMRGGAPTHDCVLRDKTEEERGAVVQLIFLNEQNQNLLLAILDIGILFVYSYVNQAVVYRIRLVRRFECRIHKVLYIPEDGSVVCGDSLGRIRVLDVRGCTSPSVEFRQAFISRAMFQGATDEITSLDYFYFSGRRYLLVGSLDHLVRLFDLDDANWLQAPYSSVMPLRSTQASVRFVGVVGHKTWKLSDPTTFSESPPVTPRLLVANTAEEEVLLESIICAELQPDNVKNAMDSLVDEDNTLPRGLSRRGAKVGTPLSGMGSPKIAVTRPFFLTDVAHPQEEHARKRSFSIASSVDSTRQLQPTQRAQEQQGASLLSTLPEGGCLLPRTTEHVSPGPSCVGRCLQVRTRVCGALPSPTSSPTSSPTHALLLLTTEQQAAEQQSETPREDTSLCPPSSTGFELIQRKKQVLLGMVRRLEAVLPKGFANGELTRDANELLMGDTRLGFRQTKCGRSRTESGELKLALETRRRLAERMEEYKKTQAKRRSEKRSSLPRVAARHVLTPVVFPQPSVLPTEAKASFAWMLKPLSVGVPQQQITHAGNTM
ncbi:hypothetical protein TraAM80_07762 [Trypanosoma rangeli]|uniref:Uncharacterized protein n=1 Tax=Trypanosoma rangeli TaxID=5698 RepID=A0A422N406_TRYRA|nr:uncharacterized protein TraAM80_07762 [Trypanosoma rangeli]RNF00181.1 hypothetical protein TraAM80_07762 [Trypanosoma rangeli]|eukprot:RNF00181.1 hypothetical protein TraAM80_07762 [Trypanosoma rangeli]